MKGLPKLGDLLAEARNHKETWVWDGVIPARDTTLLAAFMKKGKTTLLTGLVNAWLKKGSYCSRGVSGVRKILYLAPEESVTLIRRLDKLGFGSADESGLVVVPRGHLMWAELVRRYRMREWPQVVAELKSEGFDTVILDGLHTMRKMFEPQTSDDNDGVELFVTNFLHPMEGLTVVAALHTKKGGGDPRIHVPPEEMIRGASAWMTHPGQILVMEHMRKEDMKRFHAFGRHEGNADGWVIKYNEQTRDYEAVGHDEDGDVEQVTQSTEEMKEDARVTEVVLAALRLAGPDGLQVRKIQELVTTRTEVWRRVVKGLVEGGVVREEKRKNPKGGPTAWIVLNEIESLEPEE